MGADTMKFNMVVTRVFDAPVESVWNAWKDPVLVKRWWGPLGFTAPIADMDFREGGTSLVCMRSPEGYEIYNSWTYRQIVPTTQIEFILNFTDKEGNTLDPAAIGMPPGIPIDVPHVISFKLLDSNKTELTVTELGYSSEEVVAISRSGMEECLDKMAAVLAEM